MAARATALAQSAPPSFALSEAPTAGPVSVSNTLIPQRLHDSVSALCSLRASPETERWGRGNTGAFSGMGAVSPLG